MPFQPYDTSLVALIRLDRARGVQTCPTGLALKGLARQSAITYVVNDMEAYDLGARGVNVLRLDASKGLILFSLTDAVITASVDDDDRPLQSGDLQIL